MLTEAGCLARRERLWETLDDQIDWALVADPRHVCYFSGFWVNPLSFSHGERGFLLLRRDGQATLLADNFARCSTVAEPFVTDENIATWYDHQHSVKNRDHVLIALLDTVSASSPLDPKRGVVEGEWLPLLAGVGLAERTDLGQTVRELRRVKQPDEIELLARCMAAGQAGHGCALEVIRPGMTEFELYRQVQDAAQAAAGIPALIYGDFRATNAQHPDLGGLPTQTRLAAGDLMIVDYSVMIQGYRSDFTNTLAVGDPSDEQIRLFNCCTQAMAAAEEQLRPGTMAADVYHAASTVLESGGFGPLAHHAGHGLGLGHPESPIFAPNSTDRLIAGDVVTIEPGAYIAGVGGVRVEHNYRVTDDSCERLSHHKITLR